MIMNRLFLFNYDYTRQPFFFLKKEFFVLHNNFYSLSSYRSFFLSGAKSNRLLFKKYELFLFRAQTFFCCLFLKKILSNCFLIKKETAYLQRCLTFQSNTTIYVNINRISCQWDFFEQSLHKDEIVYTYSNPLVKEVIDYLGVAFFIF